MSQVSKKSSFTLVLTCPHFRLPNTQLLDFCHNLSKVVLQVLRWVSLLWTICQILAFGVPVFSFPAPKRKCNPPSLSIRHPPIVAVGPALLPGVLLLPSSSSLIPRSCFSHRFIVVALVCSSVFPKEATSSAMTTDLHHQRVSAASQSSCAILLMTSLHFSLSWTSSKLPDFSTVELDLRSEGEGETLILQLEFNGTIHFTKFSKTSFVPRVQVVVTVPVVKQQVRPLTQSPTLHHSFQVPDFQGVLINTVVIDLKKQDPRRAK